MKMLIKNANIITPFEIKRNSSLVVENGKISAVFRDTIDETDLRKLWMRQVKYLPLALSTSTTTATSVMTPWKAPMKRSVPWPISTYSTESLRSF